MNKENLYTHPQWNSYYQNDELILDNLHDTGIYSSTLSSYFGVIYHLEKNKIVDKIKFINSHSFFKNDNNTDLYPILYKTNSNINFDNYEKIDVTNPIGDDKYNTLSYKDYNLVTNRYYLPSDIILDNIKKLKKKYNIDVNNTIGILYRGTDRFYENFKPELYIQKCKEILYENPELKILIQTDQEQFINKCYENFDNEKIIIINELPKTTGNLALHFTDIEDRLTWAINLDTSIRIISECKYLINHNGSVAFMCCLYRGNSNNMFMINKFGELV